MPIHPIIQSDTEQIIQENNGLAALNEKTILITGASGMIGSYFVYTLITLNEKHGRNLTIIPVVRNLQKLPPSILNRRYVHPIVQDICQPLSCEEPVDYVIHAASPASPKIMKDYPVETNFANTLGTANTLLFAREKGAAGYLYISSREIYGEPQPEQKYFTEYGPLGQLDHLIPRNGYAEGKKAAENMCSAFHEEYGLNAKIVRLAHTYGPGMTLDDGRVQADFLRNVVNSEDIILKSDGSMIRTYTYISDAVSAMFKILLESTDLVYNVADEKNETSIRELAETLITIYPERNLKLVFDVKDTDSNRGTASFTRGILSTKKIHQELGWQAKYSIRAGFQRTLEYLESNQ